MNLNGNELRSEGDLEPKDTDVSECDVLIIGASLSGSCLARQLKLKHPALRITQLEKKRDFHHWVGESTLEVFWDYCVRYLDLGHYLDTEHLYKHGLRWFFDSEGLDLPLSQMSEMGRTWYHGIPASQLDRKKFDQDMVAMNRASGIDVHLGEKVNDIQIDRKMGHLVKTSKGTYRCRWLVDASGFAAPLGKKVGQTSVQYSRHPVRSCWGRVCNMAKLDLQGDHAWRSKVNHTSRYLSTNHFMYRGYWIWIIPVNATTTSVGVTIREDVRPDISISNAEEFLAFLKSHRVFRDLLGEASLEDYCHLAELPRMTKHAYSSDRWFLTGMANGFVEAMFSYTSAAIADNNRFIGELIADDLKGDEQSYEDKLKVFNAYTRLRWDLVLSMTRGQYSGSYDIHRMHYQPIAMGYFGIMLPRSMAEKWTFESAEDVRRLSEEELYQRGAAVMFGDRAIYTALHRWRDDFEQFLIERNELFSNNQGRFFDSKSPGPIVEQMEASGRNLDGAALMQAQLLMYRVCVEYTLGRLAELEGLTISGQLREQAVVKVLTESLTFPQALQLLRSMNTTATQAAE